MRALSHTSRLRRTALIAPRTMSVTKHESAALTACCHRGGGRSAPSGDLRARGMCIAARDRGRYQTTRGPHSGVRAPPHTRESGLKADLLSGFASTRSSQCKQFWGIYGPPARFIMFSHCCREGEKSTNIRLAFLLDWTDCADQPECPAGNQRDSRRHVLAGACCACGGSHDFAESLARVALDASRPGLSRCAPGIAAGARSRRRGARGKSADSRPTQTGGWSLIWQCGPHPGAPVRSPRSARA